MSNNTIKIEIKLCLITVLMFLILGCQDSYQKQNEHFKENVIKESKLKKKLFLKFWTGMNVFEYKYMCKELDKESILLEEKGFSYFSIYLPDTTITCRIVPNFKGYELSYIDLYSYKFPDLIKKYHLKRVIDKNHPKIKHKPHNKLITKTSLIKLYAEKYSDYSNYLNNAGDYVFIDRKNNKYIILDFKSPKSDKYFSPFKIRYISIKEYNWLITQPKREKERIKQEKIERVKQTKSNI